MLEDWDVGSELGQGLCGGVKVATRKSDSHKVALKLIDMEQLKETFKSFSVTEEQLKDNVLKEIEILKMVKHRNIVRLEDTWVVDSKTFLCLELVPGEDLLSIIPERGLPEGVAKSLFFQICSAVVYCHANNVIHGDLKPENILVRSSDSRVKLIDFGFAHIVQEGVPLKVIGGTLQYCPPWDPRITYAWDDWAMGVILFAMLSATLPFSVEQLKANSLEIIIPSRITDDALVLLRGFLNPNMEERSSTGDLMLNCDWLKGEREKVTPESLSHCWSRPLEPAAPETPNGHTVHLVQKDPQNPSKPVPDAKAVLVPSMSVVRLTEHEAEQYEERVAAPLVRTKENNFFSFFNKKKRDARRKTPPRKVLDHDLPVADVGKLKSEENVRWGSKKFPWSPSTSGKKSPPIAMSTSSPRSTEPALPTHMMPQGRNRTASCADSFSPPSNHAGRNQLTASASPGHTSDSGLLPVYAKKGREKKEKKSLLSLSPPTSSPGKPKKRKSTIGTISRQGSTEKFGTPTKGNRDRSNSKVSGRSISSSEQDDDIHILPNNSHSFSGVPTSPASSTSPSPLIDLSQLSVVGFLTAEFERVEDAYCRNLKQLQRLQSLLKKSQAKEAKSFFHIVGEILAHHAHILKVLRATGDLGAVSQEILTLLGAKKIKNLNNEYCKELSVMYPIIFNAHNSLETADRVLFLDMMKRPMAHVVEEIAYVKGLATADCEVAERAGEVLENLCVFHCHCTMMLC